VTPPRAEPRHHPRPAWARALGVFALAAAAASCASPAGSVGGADLQTTITSFPLADAATASLEVGVSLTTVMDPTTVCPTIASLSVMPAEAVVGTPINVSASTNPRGAAVTYAVSASDGGTPGGAPVLTMAGGTLTCSSPGKVELIATTTAPLADDAGICPPQSVSAFVTCELPLGQTVAAPALPRWALAALVALLLMTGRLATGTKRGVGFH
jgi:hypothetical protein